MVKARPTMALDDAIYGVEHCTAEAAWKIRSMAIVFGVPERHSAEQLGFNFEQTSAWSRESVEAAEQRVKDGNAWYFVTALQYSLRTMTVSAMERYCTRVSR